MKKYFLIILISMIFFSCNDEKIVFDADLTDLQVSFDPYEGGAYMNYTLPSNTDIYGIEVKYLDFKGDEIIVKGTHTGNKIDLFGFNRAQEVDVEISLLDHDNNKSEAIIKTFTTLSSAAISVFDELAVVSNWGGFRVSYPELKGRSEGTMNIYYVGTNPKTQEELDTLPIVSLPLLDKGSVYRYSGINDLNIKDVTVVIKTEDARGNEVKTKIFEKVEVAHAAKFSSENIVFTGSSREDEKAKVGSAYLFDGDIRGVQSLANGYDTKFYSYVSEKNAEFDNNVITLDLQNGKEVAWIRIYSHLSAKVPNSISSVGGGMITMKLEYQWYYPSSVTLYGTNDIDAVEEEWTELSSFYQNSQLSRNDSWIAPAYDPESFYTISQLDLFKEAEPNFIQLSCDITGNSYRYLKVKINETFNHSEQTKGEFGMEELEVFVKSE